MPFVLCRRPSASRPKDPVTGALPLDPTGILPSSGLLYVESKKILK